MEERLAAQKIIRRFAAGRRRSRSGPHFFNSLEELDTLLDALAPG